MNESNGYGEFGVDQPVAQAIRRYFPEYPTGLSDQQQADPLAYLLAAQLLQNEGVQPKDFSLETDETTANYYAEEYTVTSNGPRVGGEEPENVDGQKIDLGEPFDRVDLRIDDDVVIAFNAPNNDHREIRYRVEDSPIIGKEAQTRYIWLKRADSATSDPTVFLEAYNDGQ